MSISTDSFDPRSQPYPDSSRRPKAVRLVVGSAASIGVILAVHHCAMQQAQAAHIKVAKITDATTASEANTAHLMNFEPLRVSVSFAAPVGLNGMLKRSANICRLSSPEAEAVRIVLPHTAHAHPRAQFNPALIEAVLRGAPREHARHARHAPVLTLSNLIADGIAEGSPVQEVRRSSALSVIDQGKSAKAAANTVPAASLGFGPFNTAAHAGTLNGAPAASVDLGYNVAGVHLDAAGATDVASFAEPSTIRKTFKFTTVASMPLD